MRLSPRVKKLYTLLGCMLLAVVIIASISLSVATETPQNPNNAKPKTQFNLDVAYAYVGEGTC